MQNILAWKISNGWVLHRFGTANSGERVICTVWYLDCMYCTDLNRPRQHSRTVALLLILFSKRSFPRRTMILFVENGAETGQ
jgi:hypothetical protein